ALPSSRETRRPCSSASFSAASVGPKSAYRSRTSAIQPTDLPRRDLIIPGSADGWPPVDALGGARRRGRFGELVARVAPQVGIGIGAAQAGEQRARIGAGGTNGIERSAANGGVWVVERDVGGRLAALRGGPVRAGPQGGAAQIRVRADARGA